MGRGDEQGKGERSFPQKHCPPTPPFPLGVSTLAAAYGPFTLHPSVQQLLGAAACFSVVPTESVDIDEQARVWGVTEDLSI